MTEACVGRASPRWLIYGAYGYTGRLLVAEALRRGHRPVLAGRKQEDLRELANSSCSESSGADSNGRSGGPIDASWAPLPWRAFPLGDPDRLREGLEGVALVLHAAGPFVETAEPMMQACLDVGAHYLDITGEVPVFEGAFDLDDRARERGVALMPGVAMDVVPTDSAAALLAETLPGAVRLELALHSPGRPSGGTLQTIVEGVPAGLLIRRDGSLERANPGRREFHRWIDFGPESGEGPMAGKLGGRRAVAPYTWGDLATAWRTTGIGDITCYMTAPRLQVRLLSLLLPLLRVFLAPRSVRRFLRSRVSRRGAGPTPASRRAGRTRVWGRVEDDAGRMAEVVLECPEAYQFTALAGIRAVEEVLGRHGSVSGTLTPAGALGARWVLGLPGVEIVRPAEVLSNARTGRDPRQASAGNEAPQ